MDLPADGSQDRLITAVSAVNPNTIVVNCTGLAVTMPWISSVAAMVQAWFPGQEAGNSIIDILFGAVSPSGKLPISIPHSLKDTPTYGNFPGDLETLQVNYEEGVEIGYRFYDKHLENVLFPFGFGLSYTSFEISAMTLDNTELANGSFVAVHVKVTNTGSMVGKEVVQVYIAPPLESTVDRPLKTLAGFKKVELEPKETRMVEIKISFESAAFWDETMDMWKVEKGYYEIL